jgi:hypothetical protein
MTFDVNMRGSATDTTSIANDFQKSEPYFDLMEDSVFLYPIPDVAVTSGLKIWYENLATELSLATDEPVFSEAYHKGLAYGAAKDYFQKYAEIDGNMAKAKLMEQEMNAYISRMKIFYNKKTQDDIYSVETAFVDYEY